MQGKHDWGGRGGITREEWYAHHQEELRKNKPMPKGMAEYYGVSEEELAKFKSKHPGGLGNLGHHGIPSKRHGMGK